MATTVVQDREFLESVIGSDLLEAAIRWIGKNLEPEDVFDDTELASWAENNGFVEEQ